MAKKKKVADGKQATFEQALQSLEEIVAELEAGQLGLSDGLKRYEEGVIYLRQCHQLLEKAERKIELLSGVDAEGNPALEAFDDEAMSLDSKLDARSRRRTAGKIAGKTGGDTSDVDESRGLF